MNSGGLITIDEPISLEELQTGAVVLRVSRNGAPPVDATLVVSMRSATEVGSAAFYAYGVQVLSVANPSDLISGRVGVTVSDRSADWQVVGVRIDRQYWHGGVVEDDFFWDFSPGETPGLGTPCVGVLGCTGNGGESFRAHLSLVNAAPLGGVMLANSRVQISSGAASINDGAVFTQSTFGFGYPLIKAIPCLVGARVYVRVLYPRSFSDWLDITLYGPNASPVAYLTEAGPFFLAEI